MNPDDLSFTCIGRNERGHLAELLPTLLKTGAEVVYVDCESVDDSAALAESLGCKVFKRPNNMNLNVNKAFAMSQATGRWIFYIDPDERLNPACLEEIRVVLSSPASQHTAYRLPRKNHFLGSWLKHGGQYPDYQLRLFQRGRAKFPQQHVHEKLEVNGTVGELKNAMEHYPYEDVSVMLRKLDFYSTFESDYRLKRGDVPSLMQHLRYLIFYPKIRFLRRYFLKGGILDGVPGFAAAFFDVVGIVCQQIKFWNRSRKAPKIAR